MTTPGTPEQVGRYQVLDRVGKGGMGVLYRGFDPVLDREVAIKLMLADFSEDADQMRPRFYREARAAARLQHRNIVTIHEFAEENNVPYIVMEFLKGSPLGARMRAEPPLTLDDKLNIVAQLCNGLGYAHEQGVVHRDVKPDNVFILEDGSVKLLDFGIAKLTSSTLTRQGDVLGSASYMSPEQVSGSEAVDGRSDIFSAGVLLYELLAGHKPFEGATPTSVILKILNEDPPAIESFVPNVPAEVAAVAIRALQKDPAARFQSADEMSRRLQALRKSLAASLSAVEMDSTRVANTQEFKAFHEASARTRAAVAAPAAAPIETPVPPSAVPGRTASPLVPLLLGGVIVLVVVVVAVLVVVLLRLGPGAGPASETLATASATAGQTDPGSSDATPPPSQADSLPAPVGPELPAAGDLTALLPAEVLSTPPAAEAPAPDSPPGTPPDNSAADAAGVPPSGRSPAPPPPAALPPVPAVVRGAEPVPPPAPPPAAPAAEPDVVTGSLFVDYVNTFSSGEIEVEVDGRRRWSEKLGVSANVGGLARLGVQRPSEQMGTELRLPAGTHRVTVTVLNGEGEVQDFRTTSVQVYESRPMTLQIRVSRFRNELQLSTVAGAPGAK